MMPPKIFLNDFLIYNIAFLNIYIYISVARKIKLILQFPSLQRLKSHFFLASPSFKPLQ